MAGGLDAWGHQSLGSESQRLPGQFCNHRGLGFAGTPAAPEAAAYVEAEGEASAVALAVASAGASAGAGAVVVAIAFPVPIGVVLVPATTAVAEVAAVATTVPVGAIAVGSLRSTQEGLKHPRWRLPGRR